MPRRPALAPHRLPRSLALLIALAALFGTSARAQTTRRPAARFESDTLTVGTYAYATNDRLANITPLAHYLSERLKREVRVVSLPDPPALAAAVREGRVDVAVMNTFGYLLLTADAAPAGRPVATFRIRAGEQSNYRSGIIARRGTVRSLAELRDRAATLSIALVAPGSTTGNLVPRLALAARGIPELEQMFRRVTYAGTHAGALAAVRAGDADIAALATEEYERGVAADSTIERDVRVLWQSDDILLSSARRSHPRSAPSSRARSSGWSAPRPMHSRHFVRGGPRRSRPTHSFRRATGRTTWYAACSASPGPQRRSSSGSRGNPAQRAPCPQRCAWGKSSVARS